MAANSSIFDIKIFVFIYFISSITATTFECNSNAIVHLPKNEIGFFRSNYSKILTENGYCSLNFLSSENNTENRMFAVIETYDNININGRTFFHSPDELSFTVSSISKNMYIRQGYVIFEDTQFECPLESISRDAAFTFVDETQILHIRSSYSEEHLEDYSCQWQFIAPDGYGFKIVFIVFDFDSWTELVIRNKTVTFLNEKFVELNFPYYNSGNWIEISLSNRLLFSKPSEFYVTIVKQNFTETIDIGYMRKAGRKTIWSNIDEYLYEYGNNVRYKHSVIIHPNTEINVQLLMQIYELGVDHLWYYDDKNEPHELEYLKPIAFAPNDDGSEKNVLFEFVSDGSFNLIGFELHFTEINCQCADPIITCSETSEYSITKDELGSYCGNIKCNFTIIPCETEYMVLAINGYYNYMGDEEIFGEVFSNDIIVHSIEEATYYAEIYLQTSNKNIIQISTSPKPYPRELKITVKPIKIPPVDLKIILSPENPTYVIETGKYKFVTVEIPESKKLENITLIIYQFLEISTTPIYNNESLTFNILSQWCSIHHTIAWKCEIPKRKIAIFASNAFISPVFAIRLSKTFDHCVFDETFFYAKDDKNFTVSAIATNENDCIITIFNGFYLNSFISQIWTSAEKENLSVFIGKEKLYFEFNSETAKTWKNIGLFATFYTIKIPKKTALLMKIIEYRDSIDLSSPGESVIATPLFESWVQFCVTGKFVTYEIGKYPTTFTATKYTNPELYDFYFMVNDKKIYLNETKTSVNFQNQVVSLYYNFSSTTYQGIVLHINIEEASEIKTNLLE